jgi:hypothetical protein
MPLLSRCQAGGPAKQLDASETGRERRMVPEPCTVFLNPNAVRHTRTGRTGPVVRPHTDSCLVEIEQEASLQPVFTGSHRFSSRPAPTSARPLRLVHLAASVAGQPQPQIGRCHRHRFNLRHPHLPPYLISFVAVVSRSFYIRSSCTR